MALDSKKIDSTLKQLENAAKGAIRSLNDITNNEFKDSPLEKDPLVNIGLIVSILQNAKEKAAANVRFEGLSDEEVTQMQADEREVERVALQLLVQEKLAKRQPAEPAVTDEPSGDELTDEPSGDELPPV